VPLRSERRLTSFSWMTRPGRPAIRRLAAILFITSAGTNAAGVAVPAAVYAETGSATWLSLTFFLTFGIGGLLGPVAGAIADRFDRRRVAVVSSVLSGLSWLAILLGDGPLWLATMGFLAGVLAMPAGAALMAAIPNLVEEDDLDWANGTLVLARKSAQVPGFVLGGALAGTVGPEAAFVVNAVTFAVEAVAIATIPGRFQAEDADVDDERKGSVFAGFPVVWRDPVLRPLFVVWTTLFLTIDIAVVADLPLVHELGWGDLGYGLLNASWGVGAALGAFLGRRITRRWEPWAVLIGVVGAAAGYFVIALGPILLFAMLGNAIAGGSDAGDEVAGSAIIQRATPDAYRGRVFSAIFTAGFAANAVGFVFAGYLVNAVGPRATYAIAGGGSLLAAPLVRPMFRALRQRDEAMVRAGLSRSAGR
jgi:MFS family permease